MFGHDAYSSSKSGMKGVSFCLNKNREMGYKLLTGNSNKPITNNNISYNSNNFLHRTLLMTVTKVQLNKSTGIKYTSRILHMHYWSQARGCQPLCTDPGQ